MPLSGLKVIDLSTVIAGPGCARHLGDFGADVIKVEPPGGDTVRGIGWKDADGGSLWWRMISRNKRCVVLDLRDPDDLATLLGLCAEADVLVENLRPGKLDALGVVADDLWLTNPKLVITRVTGFGQDGPYAARPGFATIAEAMSGFASINGSADGPPVLPPIALTDEVAALAAAFATMVALRSGQGQIVDVSLIESMAQMMGPLASASKVHGYEPTRMGSSLPYTAPRGTYLCSDGQWVAISASADTIAERVMHMIGLGDDGRLTSFAGRVAHRDLIDVHLSEFIAQRSRSDVVSAFSEASAACAPVYSMSEFVQDEHTLAREIVVYVDEIPMQGPVAKLSKTPANLKWSGPKLAEHQHILSEPGWPTASP
ncbi:MAG: CoA transferase [Actinobacteria bacterium]|nr:CoA transferase [Actinomycetota bacterium]